MSAKFVVISPDEFNATNEGVTVNISDVMWLQERFYLGTRQTWIKIRETTRPIQIKEDYYFLKCLLLELAEQRK